MFNLPSVDRGGTEGWPFTGEDSYVSDNNPGLGDSADHGLQRLGGLQHHLQLRARDPLRDLRRLLRRPRRRRLLRRPEARPGFDTTQCYSSIQGTSMATPHVSAVLALIVSAFPDSAFNASGAGQEAEGDRHADQDAEEHHTAAQRQGPHRHRPHRRALPRQVLPPRRQSHQRQRSLRRRPRQRRQRSRRRRHRTLTPSHRPTTTRGRRTHAAPCRPRSGRRHREAELRALLARATDLDPS